jgi:hypothetical protein
VDTEYTSFDELVGRTLTEDDHELKSGGRVRIRALSRATVLRIQTIGKDNALKLEAADPAGGDIGGVMEAIRDLSGLGEGAAKSGVPGV